MKRALSVAAVIAILGIGGAAIWAFAGGKGMRSKDAGACDPAAGDASTTTATVAKPSGKVLGNFDVAMAGCRFACATQAEYSAESVVAQPGAQDGRLTQCPVSGVVFNVDAMRPHVGVGEDEYVTCCDACAEKLRRNPGRFVRV